MKQSAPISCLAVASIAIGLLTITLSGEQSGTSPETPSIWGKSEFTIPSHLKEELGSYRDNWTRITGFELSGLHWNQFIVVFTQKGSDAYLHNYSQYVDYYLNDDWEDGEESPHFKSYPKDTIFIKEHFIAEAGKPSKPSILTAMKKMPPGYDPDFGDWKYYWLNKDGSTIEIGNSSNKNLLASCIECHANMADRDFVFATFSSITTPPKD